MRPDPEKSPSVADTAALLRRTADLAAGFLATLDERPVRATATRAELLAGLGGPLPEAGEDPAAVLEHLAREAEPGVVGMAGPRYFGFVIGGSLPAALAADWLTSTWDQNAGIYAAGPSASVVEEVVGAWLIDLFGLPEGTGFGLTTGCQMAHVTCLAAARHRVLADRGWDVEADGLAGCAGDRRRGGRRGARDDRHGAPVPGPGPRPGHRRRHGRPGPPAPRQPRGAPAGRRPAAHRLPPGGQREHGVVRRLRPRHRPRPRPPPRRLDPRGRRVRAVGGRSARAPAPRRGRGAGRLLGHRRAQVAQRSLRLRLRPRPRRRGPRGRALAAGRELHHLRRGGARRVPLGARVLAPRPRVRLVGGAALSWGGRAWRRWSRATAPWRHASPTGCARRGRRPAWRSSTTSSSTRCWSGSRPATA